MHQLLPYDAIRQGVAGAVRQRRPGHRLIHSPEFAAEKDPNNVAQFVTEHEITYPVALDPDWKVWTAWGNKYWPAFYLYDSHGLRLKHVGEGDYENTENTIRALLNVDPASPRATVVPEAA